MLNKDEKQVKNEIFNAFGKRFADASIEWYDNLSKRNNNFKKILHFEIKILTILQIFLHFFVIFLIIQDIKISKMPDIFLFFCVFFETWNFLSI